MFEITSKEQFQQLLSKHQVIVVDIYADWCYPCKVMAPEFEKLAAKYSSKNPNVLFCKSNAENHVFQIKGLPTIEFFVNGQSHHTILGADLENVRETLHKMFPETNEVQQKEESNIGFVKKKSSGGYKTYGAYK